jgi:hypothetical protein
VISRRIVAIMDESNGLTTSKWQVVARELVEDEAAEKPS